MPNIKNFINDNMLSIAAFITTGAILGIVQIKVSLKLILLERFIPGWGWAELVLLSVYASFVIHKMKDPARVAFWRRTTWAVFSGVFFAKLIGGLFGIAGAMIVAFITAGSRSILTGLPRLQEADNL
ncbi:MAG TPA: hypothetical protein ENI15_02090 [Spirochaetes bacterium]|nr:hypothetical protein [Spirochaetota bacterium]